MHKNQFCQKILTKALSGKVHEKRIQCLTRFVSSLLDYDVKLSVSEIGKKLRSKTTVKHKLKSADYFARNERFEKEQKAVYRGIVEFFWSGYREVVILVDWSGACSKGYYVLQASIAGHGRSVPVYQKIYGEKEQEQKEVHKEFLKDLSQIIPEGTKVTIITDAGFHRDWFEKVRELGWDYVGRIYSLYSYRLEGETTWRSVKAIEFGGYEKAKGYGEVELGKTKSMKGYLYSYKARLSGKGHKKNPYPSHERAHSNYYRNGWVIMSSLNRPAVELIKFYRKRMQIEQNFRDIKNERYGIGLRRNQSTMRTRISMLYFLGTLIMMILWWIGLAAEAQGKHYRYQANTIRRKRVISLVHLGRLVSRHEGSNFSWRDMLYVIEKLQMQYMDFIQNGFLI